MGNSEYKPTYKSIKIALLDKEKSKETEKQFWDDIEKNPARSKITFGIIFHFAKRAAWIFNDQKTFDRAFVYITFACTMMYYLLSKNIISHPFWLGTFSLVIIIMIAHQFRWQTHNMPALTKEETSQLILLQRQKLTANKRNILITGILSILIISMNVTNNAPPAIVWENISVPIKFFEFGLIAANLYFAINHSHLSNSIIESLIHEEDIKQSSVFGGIPGFIIEVGIPLSITFLCFTFLITQMFITYTPECNSIPPCLSSDHFKK